MPVPAHRDQNFPLQRACVGLFRCFGLGIFALEPAPSETVVPLLLGWAPFVLLESREGERPPQFSRSPFARVPVLKHGIDDRRDTLHHFGLRPYTLHVSTPLLWLDHSGHRLPRRRRASWISPCLTWSSAAKSSRTKNQR